MLTNSFPPFIKLSWLNLALGNERSLPHPHAAQGLVPRTYPGSDSDPQHSDSLSGLHGTGRDLSWFSQTLVLSIGEWGVTRSMEAPVQVPLAL